ncbi:hypothetical protein [Acidianus sp. HS-5]|uniref:hypothetical protein n=1 Tax=Acidianus sp. HS-5 TaxID=2886040 RepID=UPI001F261955|nr:hypothetical protein [Acidianus sp. HS-5]BDC17376.1 hypothetical protein HS5_02660 [Acidianus sp. HS-5]
MKIEISIPYTIPVNIEGNFNSLSIKEEISAEQVINSTQSASLRLIKINGSKVNFSLIFTFHYYLGYPADGITVMLPIMLEDSLKVNLPIHCNIQGLIPFLNSKTPYVAIQWDPYYYTQQGGASNPFNIFVSKNNEIKAYCGSHINDIIERKNDKNRITGMKPNMILQLDFKADEDNISFKISDITDPNNAISDEISAEWKKFDITPDFTNSYFGVNFGSGASFADWQILYFI